MQRTRSPICSNLFRIRYIGLLRYVSAETRPSGIKPTMSKKMGTPSRRLRLFQVDQVPQRRCARGFFAPPSIPRYRPKNFRQARLVKIKPTKTDGSHFNISINCPDNSNTASRWKFCRQLSNSIKARMGDAVFAATKNQSRFKRTPSLSGTALHLINCIV
jgi:hypothetical protein